MWENEIQVLILADLVKGFEPRFPPPRRGLLPLGLKIFGTKGLLLMLFHFYIKTLKLDYQGQEAGHPGDSMNYLVMESFSPFFRSNECLNILYNSSFVSQLYWEVGGQVFHPNQEEGFETMSPISLGC